MGHEVCYVKNKIETLVGEDTLLVNIFYTDSIRSLNYLTSDSKDFTQ